MHRLVVRKYKWGERQYIVQLDRGNIQHRVVLHEHERQAWGGRTQIHYFRAFAMDHRGRGNYCNTVASDTNQQQVVIRKPIP